MALVEYSDSSSASDDGNEACAEHYDDPAPEATDLRLRQLTSSRKRKLSSAQQALPSLPATFLDQYSSTVRASTQDDPSLHAGRKRVTPHVQGHWPTHVYLEWYPDATELRQLSDLVSHSHGANPSHPDVEKSLASGSQVHSLLESDLGVPLPLHISLSRPLTLRTEQRATFLERLHSAVNGTGVHEFQVQPSDLTWHANESFTRWFLVLRLRQADVNDPLQCLLACANAVASDFDQRRLYASADVDILAQSDKFHISLAWALPGALTSSTENASTAKSVVADRVPEVPAKMLTALSQLKIDFSVVKLRIGQEVHSIELRRRRHDGV